VTGSSSVFEKLKARGEEVFGQVASQLSQNPRFMRAMQGAMQGKESVERLVGKALKQMNIPTRTEFKRALARIETLESELAALKARAERPARRARAKREK
jgi:BMFP domain-containing protein YqiC